MGTDDNLYNLKFCHKKMAKKGIKYLDRPYDYASIHSCITKRTQLI